MPEEITTRFSSIQPKSGPSLRFPRKQPGENYHIPKDSVKGLPPFVPDDALLIRAEFVRETAIQSAAGTGNIFLHQPQNFNLFEPRFRTGQVSECRVGHIFHALFHAITVRRCCTRTPSAITSGSIGGGLPPPI
jgi:hypothetical protein